MKNRYYTNSPHCVPTEISNRLAVSNCHHTWIIRRDDDAIDSRFLGEPALFFSFPSEEIGSSVTFLSRFSSTLIYIESKIKIPRPSEVNQREVTFNYHLHCRDCINEYSTRTRSSSSRLFRRECKIHRSESVVEIVSPMRHPSVTKEK